MLISYNTSVHLEHLMNLKEQVFFQHAVIISQAGCLMYCFFFFFLGRNNILRAICSPAIQPPLMCSLECMLY